MNAANMNAAIRTTGSRKIPLGSRRLRLVLEAPVEVQNAQGGAAMAFSPVITLWARLDAGPGRELAIGERLEARTETRITIRWRGGVDATMRFALGARIFPIVSAFDPDGRKRELVCLCQEIAR